MSIASMYTRDWVHECRTIAISGDSHKSADTSPPTLVIYNSQVLSKVAHVAVYIRHEHSEADMPAQDMRRYWRPPISTGFAAKYM